MYKRMILKDASETQFEAGQDLSNREISGRTNNYLKLAGASDGVINQIGSIFARTGVLRLGSLNEKFELNPDGSLRDASNSSISADISLPNARPDAFIYNRSIDTTIIGTGEVLKEFGEFVESNPVAKYALMGLDVASGPAVYAVRNFTPVGDILDAATSKVAGFFAEGLQSAGRPVDAAQAGGIGGAAMLSMGAGGFAGAVKGIKSLIDDVKIARPEKVVNKLNDFPTQHFQFGNNKFILDKPGMKHILERHHPDYFGGEVKDLNSFFPRDTTVDDINHIASEVLKQNKEALTKTPNITNLMKQFSGSVNGVDYIIGLNKGRIGQLFPKEK